ncbi:pyridoxal phosphate-dependent transferase [Hygrophoropsis aurantiaca]|uniref:Pyridoxal phosphate-dependent transferase n=1 Tax=Hygrophoropsis aurantiaca TaxID=72124 RepID=A0ACB8ACE1_9AGAM|nr:pyridoxal phosphate-dependent transferase [Hygrophoropsis aurantiaca]
MLGYIAALMHNPNNISPDSAPYTSHLEYVVGQQLCGMIGYPVEPVHGTGIDDEISAWGHITSGGTVANLESMWAARNCKFLPLSLKWASEVGHPLNAISSMFKIVLCTGTTKPLSNCSPWELLNLTSDEIITLRVRLSRDFGFSGTYVQEVLDPYLISTTGKQVLEAHFDIKLPPQYLISQSMHYSWPKSAGLAGIGEENIVGVPLAYTGRMDVDALDNLLSACLRNQQAVYAVVAIIGTTEQGLVDPISSILTLRQKYQALGLSFLIHADAAWGGYFTSLLRHPPTSGLDHPAPGAHDPTLALSERTEYELEHLRYTDSITIDPHKSGFIVFPAGSLCYRNGNMRYLVMKSASYIEKHHFHDGSIMGIFGVEGSKPGAAAVAAWLSHETIGLHRGGYGIMLGEAMFTSVKMYSQWVTMGLRSSRLTVTPFIMLPSELEGKTEAEIAAERRFIFDAIVGRSDEEILGNRKAQDLIKCMGPELIVQSFAINFRRADGTLNEDVEEANALNTRIHDRFSLKCPEDSTRDMNLFLGSSILTPGKYGASLAHFKKRIGLAGEGPVFVLRIVTMSPYPCTTNMLEKITSLVQKAAEEEAEKAIRRIMVIPSLHTFMLRGDNRLYMVYSPSFNIASYQYQIAMTVDLPDTAKSLYLDMRRRYPSASFEARTTQPCELLSFTSKERSQIQITSPSIPDLLIECEVTKMKPIHFSSLSRKSLQATYPENMMFYLYGSPGDLHIEHILTHAPNAQMHARVDLKLSNFDRAAFEESLNNGFIVRTDILERARMPFSSSHRPTFFRDGLIANVSLYHIDSEICQPWSACPSTMLGQLFATGEMALRDDVYVDVDGVNRTS